MGEQPTADELRETAEQLLNKADELEADENLPEFRGYQMVEEHAGIGPTDLYTDEDGDYWRSEERRVGKECRL